MIVTTNVTKRFQNHVAVEQLNLTVHPGEIYGFLGPNGAGKTTTIQMLLNLIRPTSGTIRMFGEPLQRSAFTYKRWVGVVAEEPFEFSHLSAWELIQYMAGLYELHLPAPRIEELFRRLDLWDVRHGLARDFSHGMRQKLSIVRALMHEPKLLILDEPVNGLDPHGIRQVRELILEYRAAGGTVFISSHLLSEIERTADRIGVMVQGRLVVEDTLTGLRSRFADQQRCQIELEHVPPGLLERLQAEPYVVRATQQGQQLELTLSAEGDVRGRLSRLISEAGGVILRLQADPISLEDAFVTLTSQQVTQIAGLQ